MTSRPTALDGSPAPRARVLVVEAQALFAHALCAVMAKEPGIEIVGEMRAIAPAEIKRRQPTVVLFDADGQPLDVADGVNLCRAAVADVAVCVLSMRAAVESMQRAVAAGAAAYVVKDVSPRELVAAVRSIMGGATYVDPRLAGAMLRRNQSTTRGSSELSARESEVIRLIVDGFANKEIGARLHLSEKTVKNHVSRIFTKLNVNARTQAAVTAIRSGLV
ncbi:MAG: response regulator transcription factor [Vulcanimicrobiaceae bacterium]